MDYISEASHYMYDDDYIVEMNYWVDGVVYHSKKESDEALRKLGFKEKEIADKIARGHRVIKNKILQSKKNKTHASDAEIADFKDWRSGFSKYKPGKKAWEAAKKDIMNKHGVDISKGHDYYHIPEIRKDINKHKLG